MAAKRSKLYELPGGATRSEKAPAFNLVPSAAIRRIATRFGVGAEKHGADNWKRSTETREDAKAFATEAYNHMMEHMLQLIEGNASDDHLGAIGWGVAALSYVEEKFNCSFTEL